MSPETFITLLLDFFSYLSDFASYSFTQKWLYRDTFMPGILFNLINNPYFTKEMEHLLQLIFDYVCTKVYIGILYTPYIIDVSIMYDYLSMRSLVGRVLLLLNEF